MLFPSLHLLLLPAFIHTHMWVCMCADTCAADCVSVDVCWSSSINIVLCSSNSSSSGSTVAARSTVYFPSWRTTSYQISRHCLLARCPTTRSHRMFRPLCPKAELLLIHSDWQLKEPLALLSVITGYCLISLKSIWGSEADLQCMLTWSRCGRWHCFLSVTMAAPSVMTQR